MRSSSTRLVDAISHAMAAVKSAPFETPTARLERRHGNLMTKQLPGPAVAIERADRPAANESFIGAHHGVRLDESKDQWSEDFHPMAKVIQSALKPIQQRFSLQIG